MLTALQLQEQRRRRAVPSLKHQYHEYILQRIESYKNSLSRRELLDLGDMAISDRLADLSADAAQGEQFLLTEVLLTDWVDRLIHRRLGLQPYARWAKHFRLLRGAQREPTHWGIDRRCPVSRLLPRLEPGDSALVIGMDAAPIAFLLAAHDIEVTFIGQDMNLVDQVESRIAEEALGHYCVTYVTPTGQLPHDLRLQVHLVVLDTGTLEPERSGARRDILRKLIDRTVPGGAHLLVPSEHALAPDAYLSHYGEWAREDLTNEKRRPARSYGVLLGKPPEVIERAAPRASSRNATA